MGKSVLRIVLGNVFGFVIFLILLGLANFLVIFISNSMASDIVSFFNRSILLVLVMVFFNLLSEIFWSLRLPFNLFAPIAGAMLSFFILAFIEKLFEFICSLIDIRISLPFWIFYLIVPVIVLVLGYVKIISKQRETERKKVIIRRKEY